jgi:hypothetical protein
MSMFFLPRILPAILAATLGCAGLCAQEKEKADGLTEEESKKLDGLLLRYDLARWEITQLQWVKPMEKLRKGYRERMQKVQDSFSQAGDLTKTLAAQAAAKPDPTAETIHANVKEIAAVQKTFIDAQKKMQKRRDESHAKLARSHVAQLSTIKGKLTKARRFGSALIIEQKIKSITPDAEALPASPENPRPQVVAKPNPVSDFEWEAIRRTVTIKIFVGDGKEVVIPREIDGKPVTSIGAEAFNNCKNLTSITIGNSVTSIGDWAFRDCFRLKDITLPDSLTTIGEGAFRASELKGITIPDSVTSIGSFAFLDCTSLTSITIGNSVTSIPRYTFHKCSGLRTITIPDSVISIGHQAFRDCSSLESITIGDSVTSISGGIFDGCSSLSDVTFHGDSPEISGRVYSRDLSPTIYRKPEAKGWGDTWEGRPVKLISEKP